MSQPAAIPAALHAPLLTLLAPVFIDGAKGNLEAAHDAVRYSLAGANPRTAEDLHLAALLIAFDYGALEALGRAAGPDLLLTQSLRLRENAVAFSQAGHKIRADQDRIRKSRPAEPEPVAVIRPPDCAVPPTAQQRRDAERAKRRRDYVARLNALSGGSGSRH